MKIFNLNKELTRQENWIYGIIGLLLMLGAWWAAAEAFSETRSLVETTQQLPSTIGKDSTANMAKLDSILRADSIKIANATDYVKEYPLLPTPLHVVQSFPRLFQKDNILWHVWVSIWRNLKGYFWAIAFAIPVGFLLGLFPIFKGMFKNQVDALRYLPLTALTGLFMLWFGISENMKVAFLAFGIIVYLLPVVMQRIEEVEATYLKTVFTLGANTWQTIKNVYIPSVMSKLIDDIRVLTAISWTYIIIAEYINREDGIGSMIQIKQRLQMRADMFAILLIIIMVGFLQDRIFVYLDKRLFPHKYYKSAISGLKDIKYGIYLVFSIFIIKVFQEIFFPQAGDMTNNIVYIVLISSVLYMLYGELKISKTVKPI